MVKHQHLGRDQRRDISNFHTSHPINQQHCMQLVQFLWLLVQLISVIPLFHHVWIVQLRG